MAADRDDLEQRLRALFAIELEDNIRVLNGGLVRLEQHVEVGEAPEALIQELFRAAHSVKGAAHSAGVADAVGAAHRLEDGLARLRDDPQSRRGDLSGLLADVDTLAAVLATLTGAPDRGAVGAPAEPNAHINDRQEATARQIRVATSDVDAVVSLAGEVIAASRRLELLVRDGRGRPSGPAGADGEGVDAVEAAVARSSREVARAGMLLAGATQRLTFSPFEDVCEGLDRTVRDLAQALGKRAGIVVEGGDVELDRAVGAALREPVLHLVRNAVDHGIEEPTARRAAGKPQAGTVTVAAVLRQGVLEVSVADDGRGLDLDALRGTAEAGSGGDDDHTALAFAPGITTAQTVSDVSGRGVGLDAVRARIERIGGSVKLATTAGAGTTVTLTAPVSLVLLRVVLVGVGDETLCLPQSAVERLTTVKSGDLHHVGGRTVLPVGDRMWPVVPLATILGLPVDGRDRDAFAVALVDTGAASAGFAADAIIGEAEVVLKPLPARAAGIAELLGAAVLGDGRAALVVNPAACVRTALVTEASTPSPAASSRRRRRVLLAEDTLTTRALERSILEAAGYEVMVAVDGSEAWELLQRHGADVVVSDVHMPRMDGIALCAAVRRSERFRDLPVVLVTSLGSDDDRRRGVDAGANAYIVKGEFQREGLLNAVARVL